MAILTYQREVPEANATTAKIVDVQLAWDEAGLVVNPGDAKTPWDVDGPTPERRGSEGAYTYHLVCTYQDSLDAAQVALVKAPIDALAIP